MLHSSFMRSINRFRLVNHCEAFQLKSALTSTINSTRLANDECDFVEIIGGVAVVVTIVAVAALIVSIVDLFS